MTTYRKVWVVVWVILAALDVVSFLRGHHWYVLLSAAVCAGIAVYLIRSADRDRRLEELRADWAARYGYANHPATSPWLHRDQEFWVDDEEYEQLPEWERELLPTTEERREQQKFESEYWRKKSEDER